MFLGIANPNLMVLPRWSVESVGSCNLSCMLAVHSQIGNWVETLGLLENEKQNENEEKEKKEEEQERKDKEFFLLENSFMCDLGEKDTMVASEDSVLH